MDIADKVGLTTIRYFVTLADELHFGRAAARMHIAQPFLSQKIRVLEHALGARLFLRTSRRVELTQAGAIFLESARQSLGELQRGAQRIQSLERGELGTVDIGYSMSSMLMMLPDLVRLFRTKYPKVTLSLHEISSGPQVDELLEGRIDVGFVAQPVVEPRLRIHREWSEPFCAVVPSDHPLARARAVKLADVAREHFVSVTRWSSPHMYDRMIADCSRAGVTLTVSEVAGSWQAAVSLVAAGMGVSIAPRSVSRLRVPRVKYREISGDVPSYGIALVSAEGTLPPAVRAFLSSCGAAP